MQLPTSPQTSEVTHTDHRIEVAAPIEVVYAIIADVTRWPAVFGPTIHAEQLELVGGSEQIRLWATANGEVKTWTSRRELDAERHRISFGQEKSQSPVAWMRGEWILEATGEQSTSVLLTHDYRPVDDVPDAAEWIATAVDHNSGAELAALKAEAEAQATGENLTVTFADSVDVEGPADKVYDFIYQGQLWQERLPHVQRVVLREDTPGLQHLEMDTVAKDGSTHTTASFRVRLPGNELVYKQLVLPPLLTLHIGRWTITETATGCRATSSHTIRINGDKVGLIGDHAAAEAFVRSALSTNSLATLGHAKAFAEGADRA